MNKITIIQQPSEESVRNCKGLIAVIMGIGLFSMGVMSRLIEKRVGINGISASFIVSCLGLLLALMSIFRLDLGNWAMVPLQKLNAYSKKEIILLRVVMVLFSLVSFSLLFVDMYQGKDHQVSGDALLLLISLSWWYIDAHTTFKWGSIKAWKDHRESVDLKRAYIQKYGKSFDKKNLDQLSEEEVNARGICIATRPYLASLIMISVGFIIFFASFLADYSSVTFLK